MIEAETDAVWESPQKELIDITPHSKAETAILFLKDEKIEYKGNIIPNVRVPLTESPLVAEFIRLFDKQNHILEASPGQLCSLPIKKVERMNTIDLFFD